MKIKYNSVTNMVENYLEFSITPQKFVDEFVDFVPFKEYKHNAPTYKFDDSVEDIHLTGTRQHAEGAMINLENAYNKVKDETQDQAKAQETVLNGSNLRTLVFAIAAYGTKLRKLNIGDDELVRRALGKALISETARFERPLLDIEQGANPENVPGLLSADHTKKNLQKGRNSLYRLRINLFTKQARDHSQGRLRLLNFKSLNEVSLPYIKQFIIVMIFVSVFYSFFRYA
jgi:hypothetical protein